MKNVCVCVCMCVQKVLDRVVELKRKCFSPFSTIFKLHLSGVSSILGQIFKK